MTSGQERGQVERGQVRPGEPRSDWLRQVHRLFSGPIDIEWTETDEGRRTLLQVRPALFPVRRNETLSRANYKEVLGDPPSPWIVGIVGSLGNPVLDVARRADPHVPGSDEPYVVELGERPWLNYSALFRLMDYWGVPRSVVCRGLGGAGTGPGDGRFAHGRFWWTFPSKFRMGLVCLQTDLAASRGLQRLDTAIAGAHTLPALSRACVQAHVLSVQENFVLITMATVLAGLRRWLGMNAAAQPITRAMMDEYAALSCETNPLARARDSTAG